MLRVVRCRVVSWRAVWPCHVAVPLCLPVLLMHKHTVSCRAVPCHGVPVVAVPCLVAGVVSCRCCAVPRWCRLLPTDGVSGRCYAVLPPPPWHAVSCRAVSWCVVSCRATTCREVSPRAVTRVSTCRAKSCRSVSGLVVPFRAVSRRDVSCRVVLCVACCGVAVVPRRRRAVSCRDGTSRRGVT